MTGKTEPETFPSRDISVTNVWTGSDRVPGSEELHRFENLARSLMAVPKTEISEG